MKNNPTTTILNWLLAASVLLSAICFTQFFFRTREMRSLQRQVINYQNTRTAVNLLVNDVVAYSKRNPAILPILESVGVKPAQSAPVGTTKPASN